MTVQHRLYYYAKEIVYPYIQALSFYDEHRDKISVVLVGSVATGLCTDSSDIDICLLCKEDLFIDISKGTDWANGRPSEIIIEGIQCHYYAIAFETLAAKITELDDIVFYVYGNAVVFNDDAGLYAQLRHLIFNKEIVMLRKNRAMDRLIRRNRALKQILSNENDPMIRVKIGIELIELLLKVIALVDGVSFDTRKRLYTTSLVGSAGQRLGHAIDRLIGCLSDISGAVHIEASCVFMQTVDACIESLCIQ